MDRTAAVYRRRGRAPARGRALRGGAARRAHGARDAHRGARGLSRPAQRGARAGRSVAARNRRDDRGGAVCSPTCAASRRFPKAVRPPRSSRPSTPGSTASPVPSTPSAAKCSNSSATACWRSFRSPAGRRATPATPRSRRSPRRGAGWPISTRRGRGMGSRRCRSASRCISAQCCGAISAPPTGWISPPSARPSIWSAASRGYAVPSNESVLISGAFAAETGAPLIPLGSTLCAASPPHARCSR